jgi:ubiquinone/menaquinone biosynthesis C-methylase UbiE
MTIGGMVGSETEQNYTLLVKEHYRKQALEHGSSLTSTMTDYNTRRLEIENLIALLNDGDMCLEVGCGNGASSIEISKSRNLNLMCIDFSSDLLEIAKKQAVDNILGKIKFEFGDVLDLSFNAVFDSIFTERCIINLMTWDDQRQALTNLSRALKSDGRLILLEAFSDGLEALNKARQEVGLDSIPPAYHNLHLKKELVLPHLESCGLNFVGENNFLSSHYFGSRVLYPALAKAANLTVVGNSAFDQFFANLPPIGNFSHIKILVFSKK